MPLMLQSLYNYINDIHPLSEGAAAELNKCFEIINLPKREILLREGQVCDYTYVVVEGLLRMYYIKDDEEICSLFIKEKNIFHAPDSFYSRKPGYVFIESLEPCILARIHYDHMQRLYKLYPEINFIGRIVTENNFVKSEQRLFLLRKQTALDRYNDFVENYPTLMQRIPLKYIASYLGLTLETLSRVRNKLSK